METLLEIKDKARDFYGKKELYILPVIRFFLALTVFLLINKNIGYMEKLDHFAVPVILALICSILPINATILFSMLLILAHLYALSPEVCLMAFVLFLLIALLYFRFAPKEGYFTLLTPVSFVFKIPYVIPVAEGILCKPYAVFSMICGTVVYFFLNGVKLNAAVLGAKSEDESSVTSKFVSAINQLVGNKEMYLTLIVLSLTMLVVYLIHRLSIDHAWSIAITIGTLVQFVGFFTGYMILGITGKIITLIVGSAISAIIAFVLKFLFFHVDYSRTERVQFEDDEYYYYVKAIPKISVTQSKKQIKQFSSKSKQRTSFEEFDDK